MTGDNLLDRDSVEKLRSLVTGNSSKERAAFLSMFFARHPVPEGGEPLLQESDYHQLVERALTNDIIHGGLLSTDGRLALMVLSLEPSAIDGGGLEKIVSDLRQTITEDLQGPGLTSELTGVPVMQLEIRRAVDLDRILYNPVGSRSDV